MLIPVLDLKDGLVVHAVGGHRDQYQPVRSQLCDSAQPIDVATALSKSVGHNRLYIADLDALEGRTGNRGAWQQLVNSGFQIWLDAGVTNVESTLELASWLDGISSVESHTGSADVILALESLASPDTLSQLSRHNDPSAKSMERFVFSLDLRAREVQASTSWQNLSQHDIMAHVHNCGIRKAIVLDVAAVGAGQGVPTLDLCRKLHHAFPEIELYSGGGVRNRSDVEAVMATGCHGALVATALHEGSLP